MKIANKLFVTISVLVLIFGCKTKKSDSNYLKDKIQSYYKLFEPWPNNELVCDDLISSTSISRNLVREYINNDVSDWSEEDWNETTYNVIFALQKENYYLFLVDKETPVASTIFVQTFDVNGFRKSHFPICSEGTDGEIKSRISKDKAIWRLGDDGVSTYTLNTRGVYVKGI